MLVRMHQQKSDEVATDRRNVAGGVGLESLASVGFEGTRRLRTSSSELQKRKVGKTWAGGYGIVSWGPGRVELFDIYSIPSIWCLNRQVHLHEQEPTANVSNCADN